MPVTQLNPYLNFNGNAAKAIQHYERALGAKVESLMRFGDVQGTPSAPEHKDLVMHAVLKIDGQVIMASDTRPDVPVSPGTNVHITLNFDQPGDMAGRFDALAAGGTVSMPLADTFWGARFGMLTDAYGVN